MQDSPIDPETGEQNEAIPALANPEKLLKIGWEPLAAPRRKDCEVHIIQPRPDTTEETSTTAPSSSRSNE